MIIIKDKKFLRKIQLIYEYIKKDKPIAAKNFVYELNLKIKNLKTFSKMYRKSVYFDDENYRDMIHKGYIVIYKIEKDKIIILDIFKWSENYESWNY